MVEAKVRRIKETVRCLLHSLPFKFNESMVRWALKNAAFCLNLFPTRDGYKGVSPRECLTGIKVDAKACAPIGFGQFAWVKEKQNEFEKRTLAPRVFPGIALLPSGYHGTVDFLNLLTMEVVKRDQFTIAHIPTEWVDKMNAIGQYTIEEIPQILSLEDDSVDSPNPMDIPHTNEPRAVINNEYDDENELPVSVTHMTIEEAAKEYGEDIAIESLEKEFQQYLDKKTLRGVPADEKIDKDLIIPLKTFAKAKKDTDGNFKSLKTRGVGRGDRQKETINEKMSSPTASTQALFTVAAIAAHEGKNVSTYDFPGAYLNATRIGRAPQVYIRLNKFQTKVMMKLDPSWKSYVLSDGTSLAEATGSLYGLLESGALWNQDAVTLLKSLGLTQSKYDPCVFYKQGIRVVLYVDDLYITYDTEEHLDIIRQVILPKYGGEFKLPVDGTIEFLGMKIKTINGGIYVTMPDKIQDVTEGITSTSSTTPAGMNLFTINDQSPTLNQQEKSTFHTLVAKLLYISKRIRPDILLAVNFLTTRVQTPTKEDNEKLKRVLKYLNGTKHRGLRLKIGKSVFVHSYIDASFATHNQDAKSHTGATVGIGDALAILVKSTKQNIVTKSSTEAELVAVSDMIGDVLDIRGFVQELGYEYQDPTIVYQDNQSTIQLMNSGPASNSKSKHVRIRTFWLRERIQEGDFVAVYKPTEEMIADGLTKPLQGASFDKFADLILGGK